VRAEHSDDPWSGVYRLFAAFQATIMAVWGFETIVCRGLVAGLFSTLLQAGFRVVFHLPTLAAAVAVFLLCLGLGHWLAQRRPFRGREALLLFALPAAAFVGGLAVAGFAGTGVLCALHPWR
jgi:hypothetical protein